MLEFRKVFVFIVVFALCFALVFTSCTQDKGEVGQSSTEQGKDTDKQQNNTTNNQEKENELEHVKLIWYYINDPQPDQEEVFERANEIIKEKINATVEFLPFGFGTYEDKLKVVSAGGEEFDIAWTSHWMFKIKDQVSKGVFIPLDDLIDRYAPKLKASMTEDMWDIQRINGKIYGVFNQQLAFRQYGYTVIKELADKYGFDPKKEIKSHKDIEKFLKLVKENEADIIPIVKFESYTTDPYYGVINLGVGSAGVYEQDPKTVVDLHESNQTKENAQLIRDWYVKGYVSADIIGMKDFGSAKKAKKFASWMGIYKPGVDAENANNYGYETISVPISEPQLTSDGPMATMNAISATSKNPERAIMFIELLHTDQELFNLLSFGIEGEHYEKMDENRIRLFESSKYKALDWVMGNTFLGYLPEGKTKEQVEMTKELNHQAKKSPLLGFSVNRKPIETELAATKAVYDEYKDILGLGLEEPEKVWPEYIEKCNKAGMKKIIEEVQKQLDDWWASK